MKTLNDVNKKNDVNNTASEAPEKNVKTESEKIDFFVRYCKERCDVI